jgi:peptidoglycan/LPS O-acetylase OafA/YrhL
MNTKTLSQTNYMPQLDALRAIAVSGVLVHHFTGGGWETGAILGVRLFFVLSGFLITGILIQCRDAADRAASGYGQLLRTFYARRFLRIFPLYYLVIAVGVLFNLESAREYLGWLLSYTINLKMADQGWYIANFAHFWSLAVEEQFYVVWPWFVIFLPRRCLVPAAVLMVSVGPAYRLYHFIGWTYFNSEASGLCTYISTLTCLDTLGMGSLLALISNSGVSHTVLRHRLAFTALPAGVLMYLAARLCGRLDVDLVLSDLAVALVYCWLIHAASLGFSGRLGQLLEAKPLLFVGKISYGIYVYHPFMCDAVKGAFAKLGWFLVEFGWLHFALASLATLAISSASWYLIESPINNLKRYFPSGSNVKQPAQSASTLPDKTEAEAILCRQNV